jgi:hypothetical protein
MFKFFDCGTILVKTDPLEIVKKAKLRCFGDKIQKRLEYFLTVYFYL